MSSTIIIPISYGFIRDNEGSLVLHPSIKLIPNIEENNGCIKITSEYKFTTGDGTFSSISMNKENKDDFFDSYIIFTGFYSTACDIIRELNVPVDEVEWVK